MITRFTRMIGLLALLALLALPEAALAQGLALAPEQPSVAAGRTISFVGSGFRPNEQVAIWATAPDQTVIGGDFAYGEGETGRIEVAFNVPDDALGGRWSLTAYGFVSKTPVITTFEVQGRDPATATAQATVAPASGPPDTQFTFAALGFKDKETVSYWFTGPDGLIHDAYPSGDSANGSGRVDISWRAPADAIRGSWVITIQGLKSHVARGVPFEIR
ncbi:MAG TPA: hypothetical protein VFU22_13960 [Roseiflexaceae bacterium]|nr:hypothetical protein [Roseiflexaceae bacterium]